MKKQRYRFTAGFAMLVVFFVFTVAVKMIDYKPIGPENSKVGFSKINGWFHDWTGYNDVWYKISKFAGIIVIMTAVMFVLLALIQFVRRRSIKKMDKTYISLGFFYVAVGAAYMFFEVFTINYRPIIRDEGLEASYPSSHTILAICIMGAAVIHFRKLFREPQHRLIADGTAILVAAVTVVGRLLSGVHWLTDIVGGIILSVAFLLLYNAAFKRIEYAEKRALKKQRIREREQRKREMMNRQR